MKSGIFYAVGVGTEPMDLTLRAKQILEQADVIVKPVRQIGASSVAYTIAAKAVNLEKKETLELVLRCRYRQITAIGCKMAVFSPFVII